MHRRQGLLRRMMDALVDDAVADDEPVAMLTASEGSIYERFGFGISTRHQVIELRAATSVRAPATSGTTPDPR